MFLYLGHGLGHFLFFFFFFFFIFQRMGEKKKAYARHTSTYLHARRVST